MSTQNRTLKVIFKNSTKTIAKKHSYVLSIFTYAKKLFGFYILLVFIQVFGMSLFYLVMFLNLGSFDNNFMNKDLVLYDEEMQAKGSEPLLPLSDFELNLYVEITDLNLSATELTTLMLSLTIDLVLLFYIICLNVADWCMYNMVLLVNRWANFMANDLLPDPSLLFQSNGQPTDFIAVTANGTKFLNDFEILREKLRQCAPMASPIEWDIYIKGYKLWILLFIVSLFTPYIKRTRTYICCRMFPHRIRPRSIALYNRILFIRMLLDLVLQIFAPGMEKLVKLMKAKKKTKKEPNKEEESNLKQVTIYKRDLLKAQQTKHTTPITDLRSKFKLLCYPKQCFKSFAKYMAIQLGIIRDPTVYCSICNCKLQKSDFKVECPNFKCRFTMCASCLMGIGLKCPNCLAEYQMADEPPSEEQDSSFENFDNLFVDP